MGKSKAGQPTLAVGAPFQGLNFLLSDFVPCGGSLLSRRDCMYISAKVGIAKGPDAKDTVLANIVFLQPTKGPKATTDENA